jgi:hypothetical protein
MKRRARDNVTGIGSSGNIRASDHCVPRKGGPGALLHAPCESSNATQKLATKRGRPTFRNAVSRIVAFWRIFYGPFIVYSCFVNHNH